jgi:hypothetical protein
MNPINTPEGDNHLSWLLPPAGDADGLSGEWSDESTADFQELWAGEHLTDLGVSVFIDNEWESSSLPLATNHVASCDTCAERCRRFGWVDTQIRAITPAPVFAPVFEHPGTEFVAPVITLAAPRKSGQRNLWRFAVPIAASFAGLAFVGSTVLQGNNSTSSDAVDIAGAAPQFEESAAMEAAPETVAASFAAETTVAAAPEAVEQEAPSETMAAAAAAAAEPVPVAGQAAALETSANDEAAEAATPQAPPDTSATISANGVTAKASTATPAAPRTADASTFSTSADTRSVLVVEGSFETVEQVIAIMATGQLERKLMSYPLEVVPQLELQGCGTVVFAELVAGNVSPDALVALVQAQVGGATKIVAMVMPPASGTTPQANPEVTPLVVVVSPPCIPPTTVG